MFSLHAETIDHADNPANMTIQALPQTTVRAIGASQVLNDPAAVVKELIDNALDARATSVAVEIHANTLDSIQVRDNGHGIPPQDRPLVARRYCTSKLINEHDLTVIGGSSLGFRGEALASAAEMSGSMTVTTRVEGEQVATTLKISQQGEVAGQERASTAVGTTVKITEFIKSNPVRRQVALKHTDQCLKRVKHLLQAYALSRPHVRLSLKILKAKNDKGNWMYAPKAGGNAEDAAFKVVGAACASQCTWSAIDENGFSLQAFLPRADAGVDKISKIGSFVSVDRRPVTSQRNVPKQITKIFRESLRTADSRFEGVKEPFLLLQIECPEQSYDPNIEPAKDDVLFEEPDKVIAAVKSLFAAVYQAPQPLKTSMVEPSITAPDHTAPPLEEDDDSALITMLERAQDSDQPQSVVTSLGEGMRGTNTRSAQHLPAEQTYRSNMYGGDEDDYNMLDARSMAGRTESDIDEARQAQKDVSISNPWVMAKMNAPNKKSQHLSDDPTLTSPLKSNEQHVRYDRVAESTSMAPPTPRASSPEFHPSNHVPDLRLAYDGRVIPAPESPRQPHSSTPSRSFGAAIGMMMPSSSDSRPQPAYNYELTSQPDVQQGTPLSAIPVAKTREKRNPNQRAQVNRPFVSPVVNGPAKEKVWFDHLEGIEERGRQRPRRRNDAPNSDELVVQGDVEDVDRSLAPSSRNRDIREFVAPGDMTGDTTTSVLTGGHRATHTSSPVDHAGDAGDAQNENTPNSYGAISGRGFVPASELAALEARVGPISKPANPPPKRCKTGDRALRQISGNAPPPAEEPEGDEEYRPETSNRRRSSAKVHRTKSSRLPLERIPAGKGTHAIVTNLSITSSDIARQSHEVELKDSFLGWNEPAVEACDAFAEEHRRGDVQVMSDKLHELLINRVSDGEMVQDLGLLVRNALDAHVAGIAAQEQKGPPSQEMLEVS